jgi:hypothetical protein
MKFKKVSNYIYWKNLNFKMWIFHTSNKIRFNKKEKILKVAEIYTRENFLNKSIQEKAYMFDGDNCPSSHGLNKINCEELKINNSVCDECWQLAIKNIKFKGE